MAEKKKDEFSYGSAFLPEGERKYSVIRWGWNGLNRTDTIDTGQLTDMSGMVCDPPYMILQKKPKVWIDFENGIPAYTEKVDDIHRLQGEVISIQGIDNQLCLVWEEEVAPSDPEDAPTYKVRVTRFEQIGDDIKLNQSSLYDMLGDGSSISTAENPRSIVQYNKVNTSGGNIAAYTYERLLLVYPDCYSIPYYFNKNSFNISASLFNIGGSIPVSNYAAVYGSRVFGVGIDATNNAVFASNYNDYAAYNLDTATDISSDHAWWSMTNSNTDADGEFTAICAYDNHVVLFKKDFMQLVYNNKNPFRVVDVGEFGCVSNKAWTILNGVLYFASQEKIYAFTGGTPKEISKKLEVDSFKNAVLGSYKNTLWAAVGKSVYTFKDGTWSHVDDTYSHGTAFIIRQFATLDFGLVALAEFLTSSVSTNYYKLLLFDWDTNFLQEKPSQQSEWEEEYTGTWRFTTDIMALGRLDVRRVKKFSMLCEGKAGATVSVYLLKDGESIPTGAKLAKRLVGTLTLDDDGLHELRVLTRQFSATMHQLYFVGSGYMKIHAAELKVSWGGDVYVET